MFSNLYYHEYKGKQVVGYICDGEEPSKESEEIKTNNNY